MKDDTINWDKRDIRGTVCGPNAVLAFLIGALCVAVLAPFFIAHVYAVAIVEIIKKNKHVSR